MIKRVVFTRDARPLATCARSPFQVTVRAVAGRHALRARVTFKDATRTRSLRLRYRTCAEALRSPRRGPRSSRG